MQRKAQPFEQGSLGILGLREDAAVEGEQSEFAVQIVFRRETMATGTEQGRARAHRSRGDLIRAVGRSLSVLHRCYANISMSSAPPGRHVRC